MLRTLYRAGRGVYRRTIGHEPRLPVEPHSYKLIRLGNDYGGWTFADLPELHGNTIISAGLGEDASFDITFAEQYGAKIVMVDPTPRAIAFFKTLRGPFTLCDKALWNEVTTLKFFAPPNPAHISHSIVDFQNDYAQTGDHITVGAIRMRDLVAQYGVPPLLKLDIEGAEIEAILDMLTDRIFPRQVLVEYDEIQNPSRMSAERVNRAHAVLSIAGYKLIHRDYPSNCLYVRH